MFVGKLLPHATGKYRQEEKDNSKGHHYGRRGGQQVEKGACASVNYCHDQKTSARSVVKPGEQNRIDEQNDDALFDELSGTPMTTEIERKMPNRPGQPNKNTCRQWRKSNLKSRQE